MAQTKIDILPYLTKEIAANKKTNSENPKNTAPLLMTHLVAGYPSIEANLQQAAAMAKLGTSLLEVQLPFSDPLADGPSIMTANQRSLENGTTLENCFTLLKTLSSKLPIPVIAMTYYNIPYRMGLENFFKRVNESGVSSVIIPDIPFDEEKENFYSIAKKNGVNPVMVLSQGMQKRRLEAILKFCNNLIYVPLRVGVTGKRQKIEPESLNFLTALRSKTSMPIATGFGISSPQQVHSITPYADIAVVGSHILELYNNFGLSSVQQFIKKALHK